jgi:predicted dehydrogenase
VLGVLALLSSVPQGLSMKNGLVRIGIIGAARVAVYAMIEPAKNNKRVRLAGIAARDPARAAAFAAKHGIAHAHLTYDGVIRDPDIDLVYVATPPALHAAVAIRALEAGKHVLVEKPFAANAREAREILAAAVRSGRRVFEAFHFRHHALWHRIVEIVRSGEIGAVKAIAAVFDAPIERSADEFRWNAALGGGALMDLGCYPLQWVRVVAREEPVVTSARMRLVNGVDAETAAELRFPSGATAEISCCMDRTAFKAELKVRGTVGSLDVANPLVPHLGHVLEIEASGQKRTERVDGASTFAAQLEAVVAALLDGAAFPLPFDDPARSMALIDAVRAAVR